MASDDLGIVPRDLAIRGAHVGPPGAGGASASHPVVRAPAVAPAAGAPSGATSSGPLGRSGVGLLDLLDAPDVHVTRQSAAPVAVEVGLERARAALLRGLPVDALVTLDTIWEGAKRTEHGWYLRSGALVVLGLPGEGDRLAAAGLALRSSSVALRFLQSLARLALGDLAGARATLAVALQQRPADPLLMAQDAVVLAQQGDREGAESALRLLSQRAAPDDPVSGYARDAVRAALAGRMRAAGVMPPLDPGMGLGTGPPRGGLPMPVTAVLQAIDDSVTVAGDPLAAAMQKLGARAALLPASELATDVRVLLRALSSGGVLSGACRPETAHAARGLLAALLTVVNAGGTPRAPARTSTEDTGGLLVSDPEPSTAGSRESDIVHAVRGGRVEDAVRLLRHQHGGARDASGALLQALVRGAVSGLHCARTGQLPVADPPGGMADESLVLVQDETRGPVVPLRLGLRLLTESAAERSALLTADRALVPEDADARCGAGAGRRDSYDAGMPPGTFGVARYGADDPAIPPHALHASYAAAGQALYQVPPAARAARRRRGARAPDAGAMAVILVLLAACAAAFGYPVLAVAFGAGASWLAIRRMGASRDLHESEGAAPDEPADPSGAPTEAADDTGQRR